jgi:hypothetical protein
MKRSELKEFIKSEIISELKVETPVREGVWSVVPARIPEFLRAIKNLKDEYYDVVGSDDVFNGLDRAESAAEELLMSQGLDEDMSGVEDGVSYADMDADDKKKYGDYVDHSDIGQFATPRDKWNNYDDDYFYALGVRIVKEKFAGDVAKAYDAIVRPKSKEMDAVGYMDEATIETSPENLSKVKQQAKDDDVIKVVSESEDEDDAKDEKDAIKAAKSARGKHKKLDIAVKGLKDITTEMKSIAREYSKADGVEKEKIKDKLKSKTAKKKELESLVAKLEKNVV